MLLQVRKKQKHADKLSIRTASACLPERAGGFKPSDSGGMSNAEIANALYITESTVQVHIGNIFKKTGFSDRLEASLITRWAIRVRKTYNAQVK